MSNARNSQNNIFVWGKDADAALSLVLTTVLENGSKLNRDKCIIGVGELIFWDT